MKTYIILLAISIGIIGLGIVLITNIQFMMGWMLILLGFSLLGNSLPSVIRIKHIF